MTRVKHLYLYSLIISILIITSTVQALEVDEPVWYEKHPPGNATIHLYFFWSEKCPHCLQAQPDIIKISEQYPWLKLHSLELIHHPENIQTFAKMADALGKDARSVPTFMFCRNSISGYEDWATTGIELKNNLLACYEFAKQNTVDNTTKFILNTDRTSSINIPFIGTISSDDYSLPVLTIFIAGMDAFNPCAFFVLLFLLSMMVHGQSRSRMALIGGIFVFFSGAIYFMFMAAWLNLFIYLGELRFITLVAGTVAILIAAINIKDYFWFKKGVSLSIPDNAKPRLFDHMRSLLNMDSIVTVVFSTIILAIVANSYELLCTAGFPMVYTRILTLKSLPTDSYYLYLLLYNLIYILPLLIIVSLFTVKLGARKLSEHEGMVLKLLSGMMMLMLGTILLISPQALNNIAVAAVLLILAISATWGIVRLTHK